MLILASSSPRRRELLAQASLEFAVRPAHINEDTRPGEDPTAYVMRLAREKAEAVFKEMALSEDEAAVQGLKPGTSFSGTCGTTEVAPCYKTGQGLDGLVVLGADTTVTIDGHILGKPEDAADAARMLRMLSGRTHSVITGVALATAVGTEVASEVTAVRFVALSDEEIAEYVATGEPMDKAGAYGIQGRAAKWIPRIEGCYFNVVGLPLALVSTMLESVRVARI